MKEDTKDKLAKTLVELVQVAAAAAGKYLADAISESMNTAKEIQEEKESEEVENEGQNVV